MIAIAAGWGHSLALRADGTVLAWGDDNCGQSTVPSAATNVVAIQAGFYHSLALRSDGTVLAWGKKAYGITNPPAALQNVSAIAVGEDHNIALPNSSAPAFGRQVQNLVGNVGGQVVFQPMVMVSYPANFQWLRDGIPIVGATNRYLALPDLRTAASGNYVLAVTNAFGQAISQPFHLMVQSDPIVQRAVGAWGDDNLGQCEIPPYISDPRAVAAGMFHSLALQGDGRVVAWGKNNGGQTNVPASLTNAIAIAAGGNHSLALRQDGSVVAWGRNWDGETNVPPTATNVIAIAAGLAHSVALKQDGTVVAWGNNDYGQTQTPLLVTKATAIAAGYNHSLALRSDYRVISWGSQYFVPASVTNVIAIAAGWEHSLALRLDGAVVAWGDNTYGQSSVPPGVTNVVAITAGLGFSVAQRADGVVLAWGTRANGVTNVPAELRNVAGLSAGEQHILGLVELGPVRFRRQPQPTSTHVGGSASFAVRLAGTEAFVGQWFHDGTPIADATNQQLLLNFVQSTDAGLYLFRASNAFTTATSDAAALNVLPAPAVGADVLYITQLPASPLGIRADVSGESPLSYQWRLNGADLSDGLRISGAQTAAIQINPAQYGDSGDFSLVLSNASGSVTGLVARVSVTPVIAWGDNSAQQLAVPIGTTNIVAVSAGDDHSLAMRSDGSVIAWGDNSFGQTNVPSLATNVVGIAAGGTHNLALLASGRVVAWGDNSYGQTNVPVSVTNIIAIAAGNSHSMALRNDQTVLAWGKNNSSQANVPVSATNIVAIGAGEDYSLALRADGTLVPWGTIVTNQGIAAIAGGGGHRLALKANGSLLAWGRNYYGQTTVPGSVTNIAAFASGGDQCLVLRGDGNSLAWGANYSAQTNVPLSVSNVVAVSAGGAHSLALRRQEGQPLITSQAPRTAELGKTTLLVSSQQSVSGTRYQWQLNGMDLAGATNTALFMTNLHWTNAGSYRVVISNVFGTSVGSAVILTVTRTPLVFDTVGFPSSHSNGFKARLLGASGIGPVVVYASTNLLEWTPVWTNPPVIGPINFSDSVAQEISERFYRAAELFIPSPIQFANAGLGFDVRNSVHLELTGLSAAGPVTIYVSTNLSDWNAIFTNPPTIGPLQYFDSSDLQPPLRFYRASELR